MNKERTFELGDGTEAKLFNDEGTSLSDSFMELSSKVREMWTNGPAQLRISEDGVWHMKYWDIKPLSLFGVHYEE